MASIPWYMQRLRLWKPFDDSVAIKVQPTTGENCVFSEAQAAIGIGQIRRLRGSLRHRQWLAEVYHRELTNRGFQCYPNARYYPVLRYPISVPNKSDMIQRCSEQGVVIGEWFNACIHPRDCLLSDLFYDAGMCPHAEAAAQSIINLPTHPGVSETDAQRIVSVLKSASSL